MKKIIQHIITVTILVIVFSGSVFAQSAVSGIVLYGSEGLPLVGVTVAIQETSTSVPTGSSGEYTLGVSSGVARTIVIGSYSKTFVFNPGVNTVNFWLDAVTDVDGNNYSIVQIGTQAWLGENLKVTHFNNGEEIPNIISSTTWANSSFPAFCWYNNSASNKDPYGALYNWYTIQTGDLCPAGWHIPTYDEWETLRAYLGGIYLAGGPLKEAGFAHWPDPNSGATNLTGFTAIGGGHRNYNGSYTVLNNDGNWWAATEYDANDAWTAYMLYTESWLGNFRGPLEYGFSVRCLQGTVDKPTVTTDDITSVTSNSVQVDGTVVIDGGNPVLARGICLSTSPNPTFFDNNSPASGDIGPFSCSISDLEPNQTYYVRAYARNVGGIAYGSESTFSTLPEPPVASASSATNVTKTSATLHGTVNANGAPTDVTFQCGLTIPSMESSSYPSTPGTANGTYNTSVSTIISDLDMGTTYYFRVKAESAGGITYSDVLTFITYNSDAIQDYEGNYYNLVTIGTQVWLSENLKTALYNDGTPIPLVTNQTTWFNLSTPAYCWYNNNQAYGSTYGALYNWYTVNTGKLCPTGWHVPTDPEWTEMENYLIANGFNYDGSTTENKIAKSIASATNWAASTVTGAVGNTDYPEKRNITGFSYLPAGCRNAFNGGFFDNGTNGDIWSSTEYDATNSWRRVTRFDITNLENGYPDKKFGFSVRCIKDGVLPTVNTNPVTYINPISALSGGNVISNGESSISRIGIVWSTEPEPDIEDINDYSKNLQYDGNPTFTASATNLDPQTIYYIRAFAINEGGIAYGDEKEFTTSGQFDAISFDPVQPTGTVSDIEGNIYQTIEIGGQVWMAENLKTPKFNDGTSIPLVTDDDDLWSNLKTPAFSWYKNQEAIYKNTFGALYNWYTVITGKLCPAGWHVPTYQEFNTIGFSGSLKETGFSHWLFPNEAATNANGFTALPGGYRSSSVSPQFDYIGEGGLFWYSSEYVSLGLGKPHDYARTIIVNYSSETGQLIMPNFYLPKNHGESVRCVKNQDIIYVTNVNDIGEGSLRAAIEEANGDVYTDVINFNIPGNGPFVIKPSSGNPLPTIVNPLIIDGFSQPGSLSSSSTMLIELNGSVAGLSDGSPIDGLTISSNQCTVKGLIITEFSGNGIKIIGERNFNTGNRISSNSIFNNGGIGIDLGGYGEDGVTENDENSTPAPDDDIGPNGYQNYPVLDKIIFNMNDVYIDGHLISLPDQPYTLEFFASKLANASGYGEGQTYLGSATVTTGSDGNAVFNDLNFPYKTLYGDVITATATDAYGNTSEFSKAVGGLPEQELDNTTFNYYVNPAGVPNVADESKIVDAVRSAFKTWTDLPTADFTFNYVDVTEEQHAQIDGQNIISFSDDEFLFGDWVLAVTAKTLELGPNDERTRILDADIVFNPTLVKHPIWNFGIADDVGNTGFFDIPSITTHEAGHIIGLYHTGVHNATMWFEMGQGIEKRSLEQDDKSWASYLYPEPGYSFGSISGHITYGYDMTESIAGALVLAINTATQDSIHSYSDADGNYLIPGLPNGTYSVYIEPLDGDVRNRELWPRNISLYIYCNTTNIDYPGEFYSGSANESSEESEDQVATVSIQNASEVSDIDFVTNKDITPPYVVSVTPPDISISQDIGIRFSEPVDMSTFTIENCYLVQSGGTEHIGGSYTEMKDDNNSILFYPGEVLNYNTKYDLYITTGVTDLKGLTLYPEYQLTFKTGQGDKNPPTIIGIIPTSGAEDVFVDENIVITFSEAMNKSSVQNSFSITPADVGQLGFAWDNENKTLKVTHTERFAESSYYTITISTLAEDMSGNALETSVSSSFSTVEAAAPTVIVEPGNELLNGVTVKTTILAVFSEPMDPGTISDGVDGTFRLLNSDTGTDVPGSLEYFDQNSQVVFRPYADLDFSQNYTIILSKDISDISKNKENLEEDISVNFTTESMLTTPYIIFFDPPSEAVGAEVTIGGKGFDPKIENNEVIFNNSVVATITGASLTSLTVLVPEGAESGRVRVKVNGVLDPVESPYDFLVVSALSDPCNEALGSGTTGANSRDVALDVSGAKAYVTNPGSNTVSVIDVETLTTEATIDVGEYPLKIDINPESTLAYVTNFGSRTISVVDLAKNQEIKKINVGINPYGVVVSPDGKRVYVANYSTPDVTVIDVDPTSGGFDHAVADITTGTKNRDLAMDANSAMLVVAGDDGLKIIELFETQFGFDYSVTPAGQGTKTRDVGILTQAGLAVVSTMDGELMFIGITPGTDTFGSVVASGTYGARAGDVKPDFSGVFLYVTNPDEDQVTVYKMIYGGSGSEIGSYTGFSLEEYWTIPTGMSPQGLAINPTNDRLYVANEFGETGLTGSLSAVKICCGEKTPVDDIVAVVLYIEGMIGRDDVQESLGHMLIIKLNDAIANIDRAKTKTAINSLKSFIDKVKELQSGNKITTDDADYLIAAANKIINKLKDSKSDSEEPLDLNLDQENLLDMATESGLGTIYPNPFNESVTINYEIAESVKGYEKVSIYIYDATGRLIGTAVDNDLQPGHYSTIWNGQYESGGLVPTGTYFVKFRTATRSEVKQIMLIR